MEYKSNKEDTRKSHTKYRQMEKFHYVPGHLILKLLCIIKIGKMAALCENLTKFALLCLL